MPALGKERSFGDRVRGQCSPPTFPVVAVSPPPWVSPETRGGGGLGGGEGARPYKQDNPAWNPTQGTQKCTNAAFNERLSPLNDNFIAVLAKKYTCVELGRK